MKRRGSELKREEEDEYEELFEEPPKPPFKPAQCTRLLVREIETAMIPDLAKMVADYAAPKALQDCPAFPLRFRIDDLGNFDDHVHISIEREGGICESPVCDCMPESLWIEVKDELGVAGRTELHQVAGEPASFHFWNSRWAGELDGTIRMASRFGCIETNVLPVLHLTIALRVQEFTPKPSKVLPAPGFIYTEHSSLRRLRKEFWDITGNMQEIGLLDNSVHGIQFGKFAGVSPYLFRVGYRDQYGGWGVLEKHQKMFQDEEAARAWKSERRCRSIWDLSNRDDTPEFVDYAFPSPYSGVPEIHKKDYQWSIAHRLLLGDPETIQRMKAITEAKKQMRLEKARLIKMECRHGTPN